MKKGSFRNLIITTLVLIIISLSPMVILADRYIYEGEAEQLYDVGLYKGLSSNSYEPGLEMLADREAGIIMLLRFLNEEKNAMNLSESEISQLLSNFTDSSQISVWAKNQVAYAVKLGFIKGYPDNTIKPKEMLSSKMYCTMILNALGHDFDFNQSANLFCELSGVVQGLREMISKDEAINRDLMVGISYAAFSTPYKQDGRTLRQKLLDEGVIKLKIKY